MKISTFATAAVMFAGTLACTQAYAQQAPRAPQQNAGPNLEAFKAEIVQEYQSRIQTLQQAVNCVQAAKDQTGLRACRQQERQALEQLRDQMRSRHPGGAGPGRRAGQDGGPPRQQ